MSCSHPLQQWQVIYLLLHRPRYQERNVELDKALAKRKTLGINTFQRPCKHCAILETKKMTNSLSCLEEDNNQLKSIVDARMFNCVIKAFIYLMLGQLFYVQFNKQTHG